MTTVRTRLFPIFFVIFMDNFGFSMLFTLLAPLLILPEYGMGLADLSVGMRNVFLAIAFGVFPLTQFFGAPIIGDFADHFGRKKALYLTVLATTLGYFLSALSIWMHSVSFLIVSRLISGFFAGNLGISLAAVADLSPDEKSRAKNFSIVTILFGVSWVLAMALGGYFSEPEIVGPMGPTIAFLVTAILSLSNFFAVFIWFQETFVRGADKKFDLLAGIKNIIQVFKLKEISLYYVIYFFWIIGWGMSIQWFSPYSIENYNATVTDITTWMIIAGITWILGSSLVNTFFLKRMGSLSIASIAMACTTVLLFLCIFIGNFTVFAFIFSIAALFSACAMSNTINLISMAASSQIQGKVMGLSQSMVAFGWIATAIITSLFLSKHLGELYILGSIIMAIALILLAVVCIRERSRFRGK